MFLLYNLLLTVLSPVWATWMWIRASRRAEPPNWKERFGDYDIQPRKDHKRIWVHAVSVGEVVAAMPILKELRALLPDFEITLSVTTSSGHRTAREQAGALYDKLVYFPIDVTRFQLAAMQHVQPAVIAIMETELWMNFLWAAKVFDARTLLINGRISDRSYKPGLRFYYSALLKHMDRCLMQTETDAERIKALGAATAEVFGNSKIDQASGAVQADPEFWRRELKLPAGKPVVVVGSTRGEEEERFVVQALKGAGWDKFAVVHAPRHLERVPALIKELEAEGINPTLRSNGGAGQYIILDSYGELDQVYSVADVVIIGGGFADLGGQNIIQPLAHGKPVLHGPHMQNFRDVTEEADKAGAAVVCRHPGNLAGALIGILEDEATRERMGEAARRLLLKSTGASKRYAQAIAEETANFRAAV